MDRTSRFRQLFASRLLHVAGAAALASSATAVGCGGAVVVDSTGEGGAGGAPSTTTGTSTGDTATATATSSVTTGVTTSTSVTTGTGTQPVYRCFPWSANAPCPGPDEALQTFQQTDCADPDFAYTFAVVGGPYDENGQCCYDVLQEFCGVGRPFLIDGRPRAAAARTAASRTAAPDAAAWAEAGVAPRIAGLSAAEREALAAAWARDGLLEHASVASFARFSLDLLAAGAPADLVEAAHLAALDEVRHARLCLALAGAYRGAAVEPGPFPCGDVVRVAPDLAALAAATAREGCVGETVAAILAAEQLAAATDPAVREALAVIARDEARHAELAFRVVAWALREGGAPVRAAVAAALDEAASAGVAAGGVAADPIGALAAHGRLDAAMTGAIAARALAEVVLPCGRALLDAAC